MCPYVVITETRWVTPLITRRSKFAPLCTNGFGWVFRKFHPCVESIKPTSLKKRHWPLFIEVCRVCGTLLGQRLERALCGWKLPWSKFDTWGFQSWCVGVAILIFSDVFRRGKGQLRLLLQRSTLIMGTPLPNVFGLVKLWLDSSTTGQWVD